MAKAFFFFFCICEIHFQHGIEQTDIFGVFGHLTGNRWLLSLDKIWGKIKANLQTPFHSE